jgi:hypothetical protein
MSELLIWNDVYMKGIFRSPTAGKRSSRGLLMKFRRQSFSIFMKTERAWRVIAFHRRTAISVAARNFALRRAFLLGPAAS